MEEKQWLKVDVGTSNFNEIVSRQGTLACFCNEERKKEPETLYKVRDIDGNEVEEPICQKWAADTSTISFLGGLTQLAAFFVVLTGFILRTIFIKLVLWTKMNKNSQIMSSTMFTILVATFFNAGILYIIAPWNFSE